MDVSFVVLAWNSRPHLEGCLASIFKALADSSLRYEICVFDNGSTDGTTAMLEECSTSNPDRVRFFAAPTNLGTTKPRNTLLRAARGRYVCVMDSDVELCEGVIEDLLPTLQQDPELGIIAPRVSYPDGRWQKSFDAFPTLADKINRFFRLRAIEQNDAKSAAARTDPFYIDYAISAFWLMRRDLFDKVGLFDERIFYSPEDVDFCLRVWKAGYRVLHVPSVYVTHHAQEISRGFRLNKAKLEHLKGLAYYFWKHRYLFQRPTFAVGSRTLQHV